MKIKLGLTAIASIVMLQCAFSQTSNQDTLYRSVGLDATFINNFLPLDNTIGATGEYLFHYIKYNNNNKFTKHALNLDLVGDIENNESDIDQNNSRLNIRYKLGIGKRKTVLKKGYVLYGTDIGVNYFFNKRSNIDPADPTEESLNTNFDQSFSISFGPGVGFGYKIFKRISLYTEAGFYLKATYGIDNFKSELNPELNFKDKKISYNTVYILPKSIILFFHF